MKRTFDKILSCLSVFATVLTIAFVTGVIWHYESMEQEYKIVVKIKEDQDPNQTLPHCVPIASKITEVKMLNKEEYELTVNTFQSRKRLIDFILRNTQIESAR